MVSKPVRVLHVLGTTNMGGAESRIMELYRNIDRDKLQFDFLIHMKEEGHYDKEIEALGGKIYRLPKFKVINFFAYHKAVKLFFEEHNEYAAVHGHMTSTASIYLPVAKKYCKNVVTIAHSRSAGTDTGLKGIATRLLRLPLPNIADRLFTTSKEAGISAFGKRSVKEGKVWTIPNAIDVERFAYNEEVRNKYRNELGLDGCFVLGHVGRFSFMKNHKYLIEIFNELCKKSKDVRVVLIGKGECEESIHNILKEYSQNEQLESGELSIEDKVLFMGTKYDVENYYQIFDYFVFPSMFEGLPGTVVEAQASGLNCHISDAITEEVKLTDLVVFDDITLEPREWADKIWDTYLKNTEGTYCRQDVANQADVAIKEHGFDVKEQAKAMELFYITGESLPGYITKY